MSDLDSLLVTFQTQLSDVMENVVKSAMFGVTRLVEDVLLVEVKRRNHEVESLKMQLQWTESKFSEDGGKDGGKTGKCVDCARDAVELSSEAVDEPTGGQPNDMIEVCGVKKEVDSVEKWISSCREEGSSETSQEAEHQTANVSHVNESQASENEGSIQLMDVKKEGLDKPSCSSLHLGQWSSGPNDKAGPESNNTTEMGEAQPTQGEVNNDKLLKEVNKDDEQIHTSYELCVTQQETQGTTHQSHVSSLEMDTNWAGLTVTIAGLQQNQRLEAEKEHDHNKTRDSQTRTKLELSNAIQLPSSSPKSRLQRSEGRGVTIKEEVITDSDSCEENEHIEREKQLVTPSFIGSAKQHRVSSETRKPHHIYHKATMQEVMKLHSKVEAGLRLQAVSQHLHRPMKKPPHTLPATALSLAQTVNNLNRLPSTSKATPPASVSGQRGQLGDKQTSQLNRTGAPWVSIKAQHHSAHANLTPHSDSLLHAGPRHVLRCDQCGKCFPHPSNLKAHLQTHTGERPFCCSLCGRSFTKLSNLKAHRRVHTGERPYCCLACGKRFTQKCNLKRHQRIHLDV